MITEKTEIRLRVVAAWQVIAGVIALTASIAAYHFTIENRRQQREAETHLREVEFRHYLTDQLKTFATHSSVADWVHELGARNPSLVLPRYRQAALVEPTNPAAPQKFQASNRGAGYVY